jgi:uncharacterized membrane protein YccC
MKLFVSELQYLCELYQRFKAEILDAGNHVQKEGTSALTESILKNRELLTRIEQMTARTAQLAQEWEKFRVILDPRTKAEIQALAASVKNQAVQLEQLCKGLTCRLEATRRDLEQELAEIRKGTRYLNSVKPPTTNYPKFVDSVG